MWGDSKTHLVRWDKVCAPMANDGLGIRRRLVASKFGEEWGDRLLSWVGEFMGVVYGDVFEWVGRILAIILSLLLGWGMGAVGINLSNRLSLGCTVLLLLLTGRPL